MLLASTVALMVCMGCSNVNFGHWPTVNGSGSITRETRTVTGFTGIDVGGAGEVILIQGAEEGLTIEADDNLMSYIETTVENGRLKIHPKQVNLRSTKTLRYEIKIKQVDNVSLSGSHKVHADRLKAENLTVSVSGSGKIEIPQLEANNLSIHISGSGNSQISGKVIKQSISVSGSGDHHADSLDSQVAEIRISGSGSATVWAREKLDVSVSGSGSIHYYGTPSISQHVSGSGRIKSLGQK